MSAAVNQPPRQQDQEQFRGRRRITALLVAAGVIIGYQLKDGVLLRACTEHIQGSDLEVYYRPSLSLV